MRGECRARCADSGAGTTLRDVEGGFLAGSSWHTDDGDMGSHGKVEWGDAEAFKPKRWKRRTVECRKGSGQAAVDATRRSWMTDDEVLTC